MRGKHDRHGKSIYFILFIFYIYILIPRFVVFVVEIFLLFNKKKIIIFILMRLMNNNKGNIDILTKKLTKRSVNIYHHLIKFFMIFFLKPLFLYSLPLERFRISNLEIHLLLLHIV